MWIEPRGFEEVHSRGNQEMHRLQRADKWVPYGVGAIDGEAARPLPVLEAGGAGGGAEPASGRPPYGPGEEPRPREGEPTASAHGELL